MRIENYIAEIKIRDVSGLWLVSGDFGTLEGNCPRTFREENGRRIYSASNGTVAVCTEFTPMANGVVRRQDTLKNISGKPVTIHSLSSRFFLEGNRYDVYTQYNSNLHESDGGWQALVTQVGAVCHGIRTCQSAVPFLAARNQHNGRITVFHMLPNCQWQMFVSKHPFGSRMDAVVAELGMEDTALRMQVAPGEEIHLPTIFFYETKNAVDFDAYRFHQVYNELYPRRQTPVLYNTWFHHFDQIDVDAILAQVDCAAELGIETFVVDAGWYGVGGYWFDCAGDWEENLTGGFRGRLMEVSQRVRAKGMVFGLWFEPERAGKYSHALQEHPDYYFDKRFLDFANPEARDFLFASIRKVIDRYSVGFVKFDFNASLPYDPTGNAFYRYLEGQRLFIQRLKQTYPDMYLGNCASGGQRMELQQGADFDSFWLSDNQGSYEGLTIVKNTLKRMPTGLIERWNVQTYCEGFPVYKSPEKRGFLFTCNSSLYNFMLNVSDDYTQAFLTGGPLGFSGDIAAYPADYKERLKGFIAQYKQDRGFYARAIARILIDCEDISVLEYADPALDRCVIQFFTKLIHTPALTVYPAVDPGADYLLRGARVSGRTLLDDGVRFENLTINDCQTLELRKV